MVLLVQNMNSYFLILFLFNQSVFFQNTPQSSFSKQNIDSAITRGITFLKTIQKPDGTWSDNDIGPTALAGLALLESGLTQEDPALAKAIAAIRKNAQTTTHTYSISLCLIFFDRLSQVEDIAIIESLAMRLLAGQSQSGGWGYNCPGPNNDELLRLQSNQKKLVELKASKTFPKFNNKKTFEDLSPEVVRAIKVIYQEKTTANNNDGGSDNSNTQFATFALWVSRRHGIPINIAFSRILLKFRATQAQDGGWAYSGNGGNQPSSPTMTGAGLLCLGLASGFFVEIGGQLKPSERIDISKDVFLGRGLFALASCIGTPAGKGKEGLIPRLGEQGGQSYYFLWSLERAATGLGLDFIGRKDWYSWGAEILLINQSVNGSWKGDYASYNADTCFAILFLTKSNFAEDLTTLLRGKTNNLGLVELKSGGVGGEAIENLSKTGGIKVAITGDGKGATQGKITYNNTKNTNDKDTKEKTNPKPEEKSSLAMLINSKPENFLNVLSEYKQGKGVEYTQAITASIPKLEGSQQFEARKALAERLARFNAETLLEYLNDDNPEIRAASISAIALRNQKIGLAKIVASLDDNSAWVRNSAFLCLKSITGKDFGNPNLLPDSDKAKVLLLWKTYIQENP
ncbi:MAG: hypothetical protein RIR22_434 [Planctomycetota bacterium]